MIHPYPYPVTNTDLKRYHNLQPHPEGGYFVESIALYDDSNSKSGQANGTAVEGEFHSNQMSVGPGAILRDHDVPKDEEGTDQETLRTKNGNPVATQIYYLLDPDSAKGYMHVNQNAHFTLLHSGRTVYTLIKPAHPLPQIKRVTMGNDPSRGEVTQLFVPGGWWKCSEIPREDLELVEKGYDKERIGALVTEVVVPGWTPDQFAFLTEDKLRELWNGNDGWQEYLTYVNSTSRTAENDD